MDLAAGVAFLVVSFGLICLTLLAVLRIGFGRLESHIGIVRDGPKRRLPAPAWHLPDLGGATRGSPSGSGWQLLLFADHSLASFPDLVAAANRMHAEVPDFEVVVLTRRTAKLDEEMAATLGIAVPIVPVNQSFYNRFNARVMPYGVLLDPGGVVRWAGVANYEPQLRRELRLAQEEAAAERATTAVKGAIA